MDRVRIGEFSAVGWPSTAVTVGNFDGVHRGHQALVSAAVARARETGGLSVALTFDPHPARLLQPDRAPAALNTLSQKEAFARGVLREALGARDVVVGESFRFGRRREGDARRLADLGERLGFSVHALPVVLEQGSPVSSSRVRDELGQGNVSAARALLGRPYFVDARVVHGAGRGRTIGVPTANLAPDNEVLPAPGVYAGRCRLPGGEIRAAVVNLGYRPTFGGGHLALEAHLIGFAGDLYEAHLRLSFHERLRDEQRFPGKDALVARVLEDVARARALLSGRAGDGV